MAGRFNLKLRAHFFNKIDPFRRFATTGNSQAYGYKEEQGRARLLLLAFDKFKTRQSMVQNPPATPIFRLQSR